MAADKDKSFPFMKSSNLKEFVEKNWKTCTKVLSKRQEIPSHVNLLEKVTAPNQNGDILTVFRFQIVSHITPFTDYRPKLLKWKESHKKPLPLNACDISFLLVVYDRKLSEMHFVMPACMMLSQEYHSKFGKRISEASYKSIDIFDYIVLDVKTAAKTLCSLVIHNDEKLSASSPEKQLSVVYNKFVKDYEAGTVALLIGMSWFPLFPSAISYLKAGDKPFVRSFHLSSGMYIQPWSIEMETAKTSRAKKTKQESSESDEDGEEELQEEEPLLNDDDDEATSFSASQSRKHITKFPIRALPDTSLVDDDIDDSSSEEEKEAPPKAKGKKNSRKRSEPPPSKEKKKSNKHQRSVSSENSKSIVSKPAGEVITLLSQKTIGSVDNLFHEDDDEQDETSAHLLTASSFEEVEDDSTEVASNPEEVKDNFDLNPSSVKTFVESLENEPDPFNPFASELAKIARKFEKPENLRAAVLKLVQEQIPQVSETCVTPHMKPFVDNDDFSMEGMEESLAFKIKRSLPIEDGVHLPILTWAQLFWSARDTNATTETLFQNGKVSIGAPGKPDTQRVLAPMTKSRVPSQNGIWYAMQLLLGSSLLDSTIELLREDIIGDFKEAFSSLTVSMDEVLAEKKSLCEYLLKLSQAHELQRQAAAEKHEEIISLNNINNALIEKNTAASKEIENLKKELEKMKDALKVQNEKVKPQKIAVSSVPPRKAVTKTASTFEEANMVQQDIDDIVASSKSKPAHKQESFLLKNALKDDDEEEPQVVTSVITPVNPSPQKTTKPVSTQFDDSM